MPVLTFLSLTAVRFVVSGACKAAGVEDDAAGGAIEHAAKAIGVLAGHFSDPSQKLSKALAQTNEQSWKALEVALAGNSFWERCKSAVTSAESKGFAQQVRAFLDRVPLAELPGDRAEFRRVCLIDLQAARKAGRLTAGGRLDPAQIQKAAGSFARHASPLALLEAEWHAAGQMADELHEAGFPRLARLLRLRGGRNCPCLSWRHATSSAAPSRRIRPCSRGWRSPNSRRWVRPRTTASPTSPSCSRGRAGGSTNCSATCWPSPSRRETACGTWSSN